MRGPGRRYLLSGLAWCGMCGGKLVARPKSDGRQCLVCVSGVNFGGCGKIRQLTAPLDVMVAKAVISYLDSEALRRKVAGRAPLDLEGIAGRVAAIEQRLVELDDDLADGVLDREAWRRTRRRMTAQLEQAQALLPRPAPAMAWMGRGVELAAVWDDMHIDVRRATIADAVERIVIGPAVKGRNTFQPERIAIHWR